MRNCQIVSPTTGEAPVALGLTNRINAASEVFWGKIDKLVALARRRLGERVVPLSEPGARSDAMLASRSMFSPRAAERINGVGSGRVDAGDWSTSDVDIPGCRKA